MIDLVSMQTLGLSPSTPKTEPFWKTWLWPDVSDQISAQQAAKNAMYGTFFVSAITSIAAMFRVVHVGSLLDAFLFFLIGVGIGRMYRTAAICGFILYLIEQASVLMAGQNPIGVTSTALILLLFTGIRATFSYQKLKSFQI